MHRTQHMGDIVLDAGSGTLGVRLEWPSKEARPLAGARCRPRLAGLIVSAPAPQTMDRRRNTRNSAPRRRCGQALASA